GLAGIAASLLPLGASLLAPRLLPREVALDEAADLVLWGSLAASLALFLPPAVLLGTVCPLGTQALQEMQGGAAGRAGGLVLGVSTLGSLAGVFGTSHLLVPGLGLRATFFVAGGALACAGLIAGFLGGARGRWTGAAALVALPLLAMCGEAARDLGPG